MRQITKSLPAWEVRATVRDGDTRPIVIKVTPCGVELRQKGRRTGYDLDWEAAYLIAVKAHVDRLRREKAAAKKARKP